MKTLKFKLYSNRGNRELHKTIEGHASVWNHCIALQRRYHAIYKKHIHKFQLSHHVVKLKRLKRFGHWNQLPSQAIQDVIARIDKAYKKFFTNRDRGKKWGRPRFKSYRKYKSFTLTQAGWKLLSGNGIRIGKRIYRYFKSRDILGNLKRCTIKRDNLGDIYICILTDHVDKDQKRVMTGKSAGFDLGLKTYLTGSDGNDIESPLFFKRSIKQIKQVHRNLSRKQKSSKNREWVRLNLARKYRKISNQRNDFHWKLAHRLTDTYDVIYLEDLNLKGMQTLWGRKINDLGFYDFVQKLTYIASKKEKAIRFIDRFFPSSKTCSVCGTVNDSLALRDRKWQCPNCHTELDRDRNAAVNILKVGASTFAEEAIRPTPVGSLC